jgi:DNA-binding response OmpR family regulator
LSDREHDVSLIGKPRIVVADDDPAVRRLVKAVLTRVGCSVVTAATGAEALARARELLPQLVILDQSMPDLDGARVAKCLRAFGDTESIPLVLLTAGADEMPDPARDRRLWDARVGKPFTPATLRAAVAGVLHLDATGWEEIDSAAAARAQNAARTLRAGYMDALAATLREIRRVLAEIPGRRSREEALETVRQQFHQIRGSAGTFGLMAVGRLAAGAEVTLKHALRGERGGDVDCVDRIAEAVSAMEANLAAAGSGGVDSAPEQTCAQTPPKRVLVLTDLVVRRDLESLAAQCGYAFEACTTVRAADKLLRERRISLLAIGGRFATNPDWQWLGALRRSGACQAMVLCEGSGAIEHRVAAARAGVDLYLAGSVAPQRMIDAWHSLLETESECAGRVLIVDDDDALLEFERRQLTAVGCDVRCLEDPARVFDGLDIFEPHLLVLDVDMPAASGLDVARAVRAADRWAHIPILIQTAHTDQEYRVRAFANGADDFITKPVIEDELIVRVLGRLERSRIARAVAERDPVTGLLTLRSFLARASVALGDAAGAAASVDVRGLTAFARHRGLEAAQAALAAVAQTLTGSFRANRDLIGRVGASLLAVLAIECRAEEAMARLERGLDLLDHDPRVSPDGDAASSGLGLEIAVVDLRFDDDIAAALCGAAAVRRLRQLDFAHTGRGREERASGSGTRFGEVNE